jgi:cytochrome c oxidase subunit 2
VVTPLDNISHLASLDSAEPWQTGFQDPATPVMEGIVNLHNDIMFFVMVIAGITFWVLFRAIYGFDESQHLCVVCGKKHVGAIVLPSKTVHGTTIEIVWTITPALVLMIIAVPSFALLYAMDEIIDPAITLKVIGHQWYWSYEYSDYFTVGMEPLAFDSYMLSEEDLESGNLRLLEVDHRIILPVETHVRMILTAADVLHCWAMPSFGVKMDACPGRLNQTSLFIKREGTYYGQCSEICGVNHAFMPIVVDALSLENYVQWISSTTVLVEELV